MIKKTLPLVVAAAVAVPVFCSLFTTGAQANINRYQPTTASVSADSSSAVSALLAGNVVGRRGCTFGRRLPTTTFIP